MVIIVCVRQVENSYIIGSHFIRRFEYLVREVLGKVREESACSDCGWFEFIPDEKAALNQNPFHDQCTYHLA